MSTIEMPAILENLDEILDSMMDGIGKLITDKKIIYQIRLACEEVIVNVIHYAYPNGNGNVKISYDYNLGQNELAIIVSDSGVAFNPLEKPDPDITLSMEERKIGGLGIFMVRNVMDSVEYARVEGYNVLTMKKIIQK